MVALPAIIGFIIIIYSNINEFILIGLSSVAVENLLYKIE